MFTRFLETKGNGKQIQCFDGTLLRMDTVWGGWGGGHFIMVELQLHLNLFQTAQYGRCRRLLGGNAQQRVCEPALVTLHQHQQSQLFDLFIFF